MSLARLVREEALAGPEHLDPASVEAYDRKAGTDVAEEIRALRAAGLGAHATLVDLGAGTGTLALAASDVCERVVAVDISPAMVATMTARLAERGVSNVECVRAGFLSYEHAGAPADVVYTRNALHHLPDFWKAIALRHMADLLRPGGVLRLHDLVFAFEPHEADTSLDRWFDAAAERAADGWTRDELEMHVRDEHSTFTWLLEPMIERAGFEIHRAEHDELQVYADYSCIKRSP